MKGSLIAGDLPARGCTEQFTARGSLMILLSVSESPKQTLRPPRP